MAQQNYTSPRFARKMLLRYPDVLIESTCAKCGYRIVAKSEESMEWHEVEHGKGCADEERAGE